MPKIARDSVPHRRKPNTVTGLLERDVKREIMIKTSKFIVWFNNPVGLAYTADGRKVKYGCGGKGASDLIGMLRDGSARFVACEVKRPKGGRVSTDQTRFLNLVRMHGGIAFVARGVEDVLSALEEHHG